MSTRLTPNFRLLIPHRRSITVLESKSFRKVMRSRHFSLFTHSSFWEVELTPARSLSLRNLEFKCTWITDFAKLKIWHKTKCETEQRTQTASNNKNEVVFGKNANPKITEAAKAITPMGRSNTRKIIEIIPISFKLSIGEFNSGRKTKMFPHYFPFGVRCGNSRTFNQKEIEHNRHPVFLRNVAACKPEEVHWSHYWITNTVSQSLKQ